MARLFFILGRGRSGTTWLARALTQHRRIAVAPEGLFVLDLFSRYAHRALSKRDLARFQSDLLRERRMQGWHLQLSRVAERLSALPEPVRYADACASVYGSYAEDTLGRSQLAWIGDKNPLYALFAGRLAELFPDARFVCLSRDPRDNVRSFRAAPFDLQHPGALAYRWRRYNEELLQLRARAPERVLALRFEDLVRAPQVELARVLRFLELDFDPRVLATRGDAPLHAPGTRRGWHEQAPAALSAARANGWAHELPDPMVRTADAIAGDVAQRLGYLPAGRGSPPALPTALGWLYGWSSVQAEKLLFEACPGELRMALINGYRRAPGRNP